jgi:hypothetical protein
VPLREIAEEIGRGLKIPVIAQSQEESTRHFGFPGFFVGSRLSCFKRVNLRNVLGWRPTIQTGMIEDLDHASAFAA